MWEGAIKKIRNRVTSFMDNPFLFTYKEEIFLGKKKPFHSANEDNIRAPDALRDALLKKLSTFFTSVCKKNLCNALVIKW